MKWSVQASKLSGSIAIPASKSHTIRALLVATLAQGTSTIRNALLKGDGYSAILAAQALGATIKEQENALIISGVNGMPRLAKELYMGNSGTGTRLFSVAAALASQPITFSGDASLSSRPMLPVLTAIKDLGGHYTCHQREGYLPFTLQGPLTGGTITIDGTSSQDLSGVLFTAPLLPFSTTVTVPNINERPYIEMTLWWLEKMGVSYTADWARGTFTVEGNHHYAPIDTTIASDFSSSTFAGVAGAMSSEGVTLQGLDFSDPQGDKGVFELFAQMGAQVEHQANGVMVRKIQPLKGITMDLNAMPDSLPALSVLATQATTPSTITNVAIARIKETDRITVMAQELTKMGARIEEHEDGMTIYPAQLTGCNVQGHEDHRVVMALTLAGFQATGTTIVDTAEAAEVTYATFAEDFISLGGAITPQG